MEPNYYAIIPATVRYDSSLTANAKLLYGEITALCGKSGFCWASNSYFAQLYNVSKTSISAWIGSLIKAGYIRMELIYHDNSQEIKNRYLYICDCPKNQVGIQNNLYTGIQDNLYTGIQENFTDNNQKENNKNPLSDDKGAKQLFESKPKKKDRSKDVVTMLSMIQAFTSNELVQDRLEEYFRMRMKSGLEPNQWKIILDDLRTYAKDNASLAIEKINGAIAGGYRQIIASWEKEKGSAKAKPSFDNTKTGTEQAALVAMSEDEFKEYMDNLVKDETGTVVRF